MSCRKLALVFLLLLITALALAADRDSIWPTTKGAYWLYRADLQSQQPAGILATQITWRMEVVDTFRRGPVRAALMRGHPADLAFYTPGAQPRFWVLARSGDRYYILREPAAWSRLHDPADSLSGLIATQNEFFSLPMKSGDLFAQDPKRDDNFYGWYLEDVRPANLSEVPSAPALPDTQEYLLVNRTMSGTEMVTFIPGIGISRYVYHHNGTVSDVDAVLIEAATHGRKASKD